MLRRLQFLETELYDTQPEVYDVYDMFTRYTNTVPFALAEFLDNSTASFFENKDKIHDAERLVVNIEYKEDTHTLLINDNAFGMNSEEFKRAIKVGSRTGKSNSRNEYGKGLKTAACWFGRKWTIESTQLGSDILYKVTIDIDQMMAEKNNKVLIQKDKIDAKEHFTKIKIEKLSKDLNTTKQQNDLKEKIGLIYCRDILNNKVNFYFNGKPIKYTQNPIYLFDGKTEMKQNIDFSFEFNGREYSTKGYVALAVQNVGGKKTGFSLLRRDRAIVINDKPKEIFGSPGSPISYKLFGELEMDSFDVNQQKDGIAWQPELQEQFYKLLNGNIQQIKAIGEKSWDDIHKMESTGIVPKDKKNNKKEKKQEQEQEQEQNQNQNQNQNTTQTSSSNNALNNVSNTTEQNETINDFELEFMSEKYLIKYDSLTSDFLYDFDENKKILILNTKHNFVKKCISSERLILGKIILAYILTENKVTLTSDSGYINPADIHIELSNFLSLI